MSWSTNVSIPPLLIQGTRYLGNLLRLLHLPRFQNPCLNPELKLRSSILGYVSNVLVSLEALRVTRRGIRRGRCGLDPATGGRRGTQRATLPCRWRTKRQRRAVSWHRTELKLPRAPIQRRFPKSYLHNQCTRAKTPTQTTDLDKP